MYSESASESSFEADKSSVNSCDSPETTRSEEGNIGDHFFAFDESIEPIANDTEWQDYSDAIVREQEEEEEFRKRFNRETAIRSWCKCSHCSVEVLAKFEECMCCQEMDRVRETMESIEMDNTCITLHPGFNSVCLDRWVLITAGIGLKTRKNKSYQAVYNEGTKSDSEYLRAVAYRQMVRFVWKCMGKSNRTPLPACVYHAIRKKFPSDTGIYKGFASEEEDEEVEENENSVEEEADFSA